MNSLMLDLAIVLVLVVFLFLGFKKGVLSSFFSFVSAVFSGLISAYFSGYLSSWVYAKIIGPAIEKHAEKFIVADSQTSESFLNHFPKFVGKYLETNGITSFSLEHIMNNNACSMIPKKISELFEPVVTDALKSIFIVFLFVVFMVLSKFLMGLILGLFKSSLIKKTNTFLGGIFGLLKGYIVITVALCCLKSVIGILQNVPDIFSQESVSNTVIFKGIYDNNPIYELFKFI